MQETEAPLYDTSELGGIVGTDLTRPFDMREVHLARFIMLKDRENCKAALKKSTIFAPATPFPPSGDSPYC